MTGLVKVNIGGKDVSVHQDLADSLTKADKDMKAATGKGLEITSSYRTNTQQRQAYRRYVAGGGLGLAAKPGQSRHEKGLAIDVENWQEAEPYLKKHGLENPFVNRKDPGHFQFPGAPGAYKPETPLSSAGSMVANASGRTVPDSRSIQLPEGFERAIEPDSDSIKLPEPTKPPAERPPLESFSGRKRGEAAPTVHEPPKQKKLPQMPGGFRIGRAEENPSPSP